MGEAAAAAATDAAVKEGCVGAGTGATVGKLFGMKQAMKSGDRVVHRDAPRRRAGFEPGGGERPRRRARPGHGEDCGRRAQGPRQPGVRRFTVERMMRGELGSLRGRSNTTLAVVATNAKLTKVQANKLAQLRQPGMARTIYPVNTMAMAIPPSRCRLATARRISMCWAWRRRKRWPGLSCAR
jgi:L-aminopeptidase/D-esterase-like protein